MNIDLFKLKNLVSSHDTEQIEMTCNQLYAISNFAVEIDKMIKDPMAEIEPWAIDKISHSYHSLNAVLNYMKYDKYEEDETEEENKPEQ